MRVLGIDPGSRLTGFGVIQVLGSGRIGYVASGCIRMSTRSLAERLKIIYDGVTEVIAEYRPEVVAVERVFMAANPDSALKLGQARAAAMLPALNAGLAVVEYSALQIKQAVVGRGHADKVQVQHMVKVLLDLSASPQADAADALACAICHGHRAFAPAAGGTGRARRRGGRGLRNLKVPS